MYGEFYPTGYYGATPQNARQAGYARTAAADAASASAHDCSLALGDRHRGSTSGTGHAGWDTVLFPLPGRREDL